MSKKDYPKMLYQGNLQVFKTAIAENKDHESELKEQNWIKYGELPEFEHEMKYASGVGAAGSIDGTSVAEQNKELQEQLEESKTEIARLKEVIEKGSAENAELQKKLRIKELEDMPADDLKVLLTEQNIQFGARDSKATLIELFSTQPKE